MNRAALNSYVLRSRSILETDPPETVEEIRSWLVEPFLAALGWNVHAPACETDATIRDRTVDYLCSVENTPAVAAFVRSSPDAVDAAETPVRRTMVATGIDRAVVTDGRTFDLYAGPDGSDRVRCSLDSLLERVDALEHVSEPRCRRRLERHSRSLAARRLAVRRPALAKTIATELADVAGDGYADEFETAAAEFVTDRIASLLEPSTGGSEISRPRASGHEPPDRPADDSPSETDPGGDDGIRDDDRSSSSPASDDPLESSTRGSEPTAAADRDAESSASTDSSEPPATSDALESSETPGPPESPEPSSSSDSADWSHSPEPTREPDGSRPAKSTGEDAASASVSDGDGDGEYVVRFFNERGSIGAIGHGRSDAAMVLAVEYCLERGLSGVRLPWQHDDVTVIDDGPVRADGSPMDSPRELSNGWVVDVAGDLETRAERIQAIASRAGLRAMLTGDWPDDVDR